MESTEHLSAISEVTEKKEELQGDKEDEESTHSEDKKIVEEPKSEGGPTCKTVTRGKAEEESPKRSAEKSGGKGEARKSLESSTTPGNKIGECNLLPILVERLRTALEESCPKQSQVEEETSSLTVESPKSNLDAKFFEELIVSDIQTSLAKLQDTLRRVDINALTKYSASLSPTNKLLLLQLISNLLTKLQIPKETKEDHQVQGPATTSASVSGAATKTTKATSASSGSKRSRANRHTIGVTSEELAEARQWIEKKTFEGELHQPETTKSPEDKSVEKVTNGVDANHSAEMIGSSQEKSSGLKTKKSFDMVHDKHVKNAINQQQSMQNRRGSLRDFPNGDAVPAEALVDQSSYPNKEETRGNQFDKIRNVYQVQQPERGFVKYNGNCSNKFIAKKCKIKRANTIDIPNYLKLQSESFGQNQNGCISLRRPIDIGDKVLNNASVIPSFEPKTDNDRKFLALINKNSDGGPFNSSPSYKSFNYRQCTSSADKNWNSRFSNIKTAFDKQPPEEAANNNNNNSTEKSSTKATVNGGDGVVIGSFKIPYGQMPTQQKKIEKSSGGDKDNSTSVGFLKPGYVNGGGLQAKVKLFDHQESNCPVSTSPQFVKTAKGSSNVKSNLERCADRVPVKSSQLIHPQQSAVENGVLNYHSFCKQFIPVSNKTSSDEQSDDVPYTESMYLRKNSLGKIKNYVNNWEDQKQEESYFVPVKPKQQFSRQKSMEYYESPRTEDLRGGSFPRVQQSVNEPQNYYPVIFDSTGRNYSQSFTPIAPQLQPQYHPMQTPNERGIQNYPPVNSPSHKRYSNDKYYQKKHDRKTHEQHHHPRNNNIELYPNKFIPPPNVIQSTPSSPAHYLKQEHNYHPWEERHHQQRPRSSYVANQDNYYKRHSSEGYPSSVYPERAVSSSYVHEEPKIRLQHQPSTHDYYDSFAPPKQISYSDNRNKQTYPKNYGNSVSYMENNNQGYPPVPQVNLNYPNIKEDYHIRPTPDDRTKHDEAQIQNRFVASTVNYVKNDGYQPMDHQEKQFMERPSIPPSIENSEPFPSKQQVEIPASDDALIENQDIGADGVVTRYTCAVATVSRIPESPDICEEVSSFSDMSTSRSLPPENPIIAQPFAFTSDSNSIQPDKPSSTEHVTESPTTFNQTPCSSVEDVHRHNYLQQSLMRQLQQRNEETPSPLLTSPYLGQQQQTNSQKLPKEEIVCSTSPAYSWKRNSALFRGEESPLETPPMSPKFLRKLREETISTSPKLSVERRTPGKLSIREKSDLSRGSPAAGCLANKPLQTTLVNPPSKPIDSSVVQQKNTLSKISIFEERNGPVREKRYFRPLHVPTACAMKPDVSRETSPRINASNPIPLPKIIQPRVLNPSKANQVDSSDEYLMTCASKPGRSIVLSKSESWHQLAISKGNLQVVSPKPANNNCTLKPPKPKSPASLKLSKQFEASTNMDNVKRMEEKIQRYFHGSSSGRESKKRNFQNNLARSQTMPHIHDESDVDKAFDNIFREATKTDHF